MIRRRFPFVAIGLAVLATVVIRLPLLRVPLDADEGGYAYLSRRWADGGRLYGSVWVDRPQALMLSYRFVTSFGSSPVPIHLAAIFFAAVTVVAVAAAAWALSGARAGIIAGFLVAIVGAAPHLQGFMFNGELAAGACSATAVALALWSARTGRGVLLVLAGAMGMIAIGMKQSGFDGLATALIIAWFAGRLRSVLALAAGAAVPLAAAMIQAALTSWHDWWFAIVGYRLDTSAGSRGGISGRLHNIADGWPHLWPDLLPLGLLALAGMTLLVTRLFGRPTARHATARAWAAPVWLVFAAAGFAGGVFFFPHYWMQLVGPVCLLGALALDSVPGRVAIALVVLACVPAVGWTVRAAVAPPDHRDRQAVPDGRLLANRDISPWLRSHAASEDQLYAFVSSADLYYTTGLHTDFRYLWQANLEAIPGSVGQLGDYLDGSDQPRWVVLYQHPDAIDPTGRLARVLATDYRQATVIDGYSILQSVAKTANP